MVALEAIELFLISKIIDNYESSLVILQAVRDYEGSDSEASSFAILCVLA